MYTNTASVLLFCNIDMAAMTLCANALKESRCFFLILVFLSCRNAVKSASILNTINQNVKKRQIAFPHTCVKYRRRFLSKVCYSRPVQYNMYLVSEVLTWSFVYFPKGRLAQDSDRLSLVDLQGLPWVLRTPVMGKILDHASIYVLHLVKNNSLVY